MKKPQLSYSLATVWQLTWPQLLVMFFFFGLGLCDVWTAGKLGKDVQAAFGLVSQGAIFLQVLAMSMGAGATAAISQSIGAGRMERAQRYVALVLVLALVAGLFIALFAFFGQDVFFSALQTPENILPITLSYWSITLITLPMSYMFSATTSLFRATRQVIPPIFVAAAMCFFNVIGNLGFGLGYFGLPFWGYEGIAWTTCVCTSLGALCNIVLLANSGYFDYKTFLPVRKALRWSKAALPYLLAVALPAAGSQIVWQSGYVVLFAVVASLPVDSVNALAGLTAGMRLEALLFLPGMAFNMTASVLVGNSLGEKDVAQARRVIRVLVIQGTLSMTCLALVLWPFIPELASFLAGTPQTQTITENYLYFNFLAIPCTLTSMILGGAMVGAGATRYNMLVYGTSFWVIRLPVAWIVGHYIWQSVSGVFLGMVLSQVVQSTIMLLVVKYADWPRFALHNRKKS